MIRKTASLLALAALLPALPAVAEEITRSLPAGDAPEVRIINASGDVVVTGESIDTIEIVADLGERAQRLEVSERGNLVIIETINEPGRRGWRNDGTDITVTLPTGASVTVEAVSADVEVTGVRGELSLATISGDVEAETFGGLIQASSTSGDVIVTGHLEEGEARVSSTSGDVEVSELAGRLEGSVVSGDLTVSDSRLDYVRASTTSGDVKVSGLRGRDTDIEASAVSGDVDVALGPEFGGRIDVSTLNGRIDNCFGPKPQRTSRYGPGRTLNFDHGTGSGRAQVETVNGSIDICIE